MLMLCFIMDFNAQLSHGFIVELKNNKALVD